MLHVSVYEYLVDKLGFVYLEHQYNTVALLSMLLHYSEQFTDLLSFTLCELLLKTCYVLYYNVSYVATAIWSLLATVSVLCVFLPLLLHII